MDTKEKLATRRSSRTCGFSRWQGAKKLSLLPVIGLVWLGWIPPAHGGPISPVPVRLGVDNAGAISYHEQIVRQHTWQTEAWFRGLRELGVGFVSTHFSPVLNGGTNNSALTRAKARNH